MRCYLLFVLMVSTTCGFEEGERGYLEGLASRYADLFSTHYGDVLGHLEDLRRIEWAELSPKERSVITPSTPPASFAVPGNGTPMSTGHGLTSSQSQPIYVPGKYSPSSCMSDKDEDEIYGFGYGVFANQIAKQQQQRLLGVVPASHQPVVLQHQHNYQTCLSPRSAYFYEFPPTDQTFTNTCKKRTTFSRLLRGLKTSHRKEKHGMSSPRHGRAAVRGVPQRVDTPDSVLQSGLGLNDLGQHAVLRSMVDPRDYDRLKNLQLNGGTPNTFEETIYKLKLQEALRKREKFSKDHEEILKDIKQGLLQLEKEGIRGPDDTYMYDEDARMLTPSAQGNDKGHWYDEPPYESDPEDFLMGNGPGPTATIQNGRVCFTLNLRQEPRGEGVISLRSAGDISLPKDTPSATTPKGTPRRGLILPQAGYPPTIIPLRSSRDRESGDYAGSDVHSISSRLSTLSVETARSEQQDLNQFLSQQHYCQLEKKAKYYKMSNTYSERDDRLSPNQSSDYEDHDISSHKMSTGHMSTDGRSAGVSGIVEKVKNFKDDVQKKISRLKGETESNPSDPCPTSSIESLPSGSGSSTQPLVRAGSNHSSISTEDADPSPTEQIVGRARAIVDYVPSPYDKEALKFKTGDIISIISMNPSGLWRGICNGRKGTFKFINVELLSRRTVKDKRAKKWHRNIKGKPDSVEDLLLKINLQEYTSVFVLNGYEDLELFKEIEPSDLDYLGVIHSEHRAKILTAVQLLHDLESASEEDLASSSSEGDEQNKVFNLEDNGPFFGRGHFLRDSGCYDSSVKNSTNATSFQEHIELSDKNTVCDNKNNLDSIVEQCNNEILARVKQAHKNSHNLKEELSYQPNIPNNTIEAQKKTKDTYVGVHGQTTLLDPCRKNFINRTNPKVIDDICEADQKLSTVKFIVGTSSELGNESNSLNILGRTCLSEKSSDSGVSSSSLSSGIIKDSRQTVLSQQAAENSLAGTNVNVSNSANRSSATVNKEKTCH